MYFKNANHYLKIKYYKFIFNKMSSIFNWLQRIICKYMNDINFKSIINLSILFNVDQLNL